MSYALTNKNKRKLHKYSCVQNMIELFLFVHRETCILAVTLHSLCCKHYVTISQDDETIHELLKQNYLGIVNV